MRPIVWLASYPRSGNTFTRALLANYARALDRPLTTREIAAYGFGEHDEGLLARCSGLKAGERSIEDAWMARAAYFDAIRETEGEGPAVVKTHTLNGAVFGLPAFAFRPGDRIVYLLRHPLDVAVSGAAFFGIDQTAMGARMLLPGATNQAGGVYWEVTGSWREHVAGWFNETAIPLLPIRYEDLCAAPGRQLARILGFMGEAVDYARVHRAVKGAAFEVLQASQQTDGFDQGPGRDPRTTFFRKGKPDQWRTALDPEVAGRLSEGLGDLMDRLGHKRHRLVGGALRRA